MPMPPLPDDPRARMRHRARNEDIALAYADLRQDWTATQLAAKYGVTRQRVLQILAEYCPGVARQRRDRRRAEAAQRREALRQSRRRPPPPHGTRTRYVKGGCRCAECRAAHARAQREYYHRRRQAG